MTSDRKTLRQKIGFSKIVLIGFLVLTLQIPIMQVDSVMRERMYTKDAATQEVAETAGGEQLITGPILTVPYITRWRDKDGREQTSIYRAYLFPDKLALNGNVLLENRYRGIFRVATYNGKFDISGTYSPNLVMPSDIPPENIIWKDATVSVGISDPRAIREQIGIAFNNQSLEFEPDVVNIPFLKSGIHVRTPLTHPTAGAVVPFSFTLTLGGSSAIRFAPVGRNTEVTLSSPWRDPSFVGGYLPVERTISKDGFKARWSIPDLGRGFARVWYSAQSSNEQAFAQSQFGVQFLSPVDGHRMTDRAMKYELLFIFLTFLCFYLFEIFGNLRIHAIQYLLIGGALVLFYLLLLSLSEHLGFGVSYTVATLLSTGLVTGYSRSVLSSGARSWIIGALMGILYGFLYTLLNEQDYALLIGSLGLTTTLGIVMYITRNIDWYDLSRTEQTGLPA